MVFPCRKQGLLKNTAKKDFVIPLKSHRNVYLSAPSPKPKKGEPRVKPALESTKAVKLTSLDFDTNALQTIWREEIDFPL